MTHELIVTANPAMAARRAAFACSLAGLIALTLVGFSLILPKSITWDPSYGLLAARQYEVGRSPSIFERTVVDPADLTRDRHHRVSWWAPGYQAIPWWLHRSGLSWANALNLTSALCIAVGAIAWAGYFRVTLGSAEAAAWLLCAVMATRYVGVMTVDYRGGDDLLWAAAPTFVLMCIWVVVRLRGAAGVVGSIVTALLGAAVFLCKYSGLFVVVGAGLGWALFVRRRRIELALSALFLLSLGFLIVMLRIAGFPGGPTPTTGALTTVLPVQASLAAGLWTLGVTDLSSVVAKLAEILDIPVTLPPLVGIGLSLLLIPSLLGSRRRLKGPQGAYFRAATYIGYSAAALDTLALVCLVGTGAPVALDGRLGRVAGLLLLPFLVWVWIDWTRRRSPVYRLAGAALVAVFLVVPALYGLASSAAKFRASMVNSLAVGSPPVVLNQYLSATTQQSEFYAELSSLLPSANTVLYSTYSQMFFPIPQQRALIVEETYTKAQLREFKYFGWPEQSVALLLPQSFGIDGKAQVIRESFADVADWREIPLVADPKWTLWLATGAKAESH